MRIASVAMPRLFSDIVIHAIAERARIASIIRVDTAKELATYPLDGTEDMVLLGPGDASAMLAAELAASRRAAKVLTFASDERTLRVHRGRDPVVVLRDFSLQDLMISLLPHLPPPSPRP